ncbi:MAG TPA: ACT domain-containing protein [Candidatus Acidoferrum sp.]|nr:ACT domain-containing protein [Candidatus Acidoferrum sp.]
MNHQLTITVHPELFGICRLEPGAEIPVWANSEKFVTVTRTASELSIVCEEARIPEGPMAERGRRLLQVEGVLPFSLTGVLAAIAAPLAEAHVSIFAVSTYDTDYLLVSDADLERAIQVLEAAGHAIRRVTAG